jgi:hypothetical protein
MIMEFKKGDRVMVGHSLDRLREAIFIAHDEGAIYPWVARKTGKDYMAYAYQYCVPIHPDFPMDHPVWVWDDDDPGNILPRHFAEWGEDGRIMCWEDGMTSHSIGDRKRSKVEWGNYSTEKPDPK